MAADDSHNHAQDSLLAQFRASKAFARIPEDKLKKIIAKIEVLPIHAGETIIRQGEVGDSFYIVQAGKCRIVSYMSVEDDTVEIAVLGPGDSFGEEALIRNTPRNATVEMMSDGAVVRLNKEDFIELVQKPLLRAIDAATAEDMIAKGAMVVDARASVDYGNYAIPGSRSIPLDFLRQARRSLEAGKTYIICSDKELESALAAFILAQKGLDACYLSLPVGEYLRATGAYDKENTLLPGGNEDNVIELPEEYAHMTATPMVVESASTPIPEERTPVTQDEQESDVDDRIGQLKREVRGALDAQREQYRNEMQALTVQIQKLVDARSKALLHEFRTRLAELENKLAALSQK